MKLTDKKMSQNLPVAIIGMGCLFPKSSGLKEYWRLLFHGEDAITDVPETHWLSEDFYDIDPKNRTMFTVNGVGLFLLFLLIPLNSEFLHLLSKPPIPLNSLV